MQQRRVLSASIWPRDRPERDPDSDRQDNAQGCTQFVADKMILNDVRFCRCGFAPIPCIADFNQDGGIDGADAQYFFNAWKAGSC